jgi:hypothetical protein
MERRPTTDGAERSFRQVIGLAIGVAGFLAYANAFTNEFVWDDVSSVLLHKHVQDPAMFFQLFREDQHAFGRGRGNFYRPLVAASFMADFALSYAPSPAGASPSGVPKVSPLLFHATNTVWHVAAALLLFALLTRLGAPNFVRAAVPLVYVLHPLHTEAVTYMSGRADMMSAAFMYAGLWLAMWDATRNKRILGTVLSGLCLCGALLSKESSSMFPFLLLLLIAGRPLREGETKRAYVARAIPLAVSVAVLVVYACLRMTVLHFGRSPTPGTSLGERVVETCQAFAWYIRLLLAPTGLHMERTLAGTPGWVTVAGGALLILCGALLVESVVHRRRRVTLALGWFLVTWFPISGLIPLNAPMAEHWMYVPMAGFFWALAEYAALTLSNAATRRAAVGAVWAVCVCFLALTAARNTDWHDNETIFRDTIEKNPRSARVHYNLAVTYEDLLHNTAGARRHYEAVLALYRDQKKVSPDVSAKDLLWDEELEAHLSLGNIYADQQQYPAAMEHYGAILRVGRDEPHRAIMGAAALGMGKCFLAAGNFDRAGEFFKQAIAARPDLKVEVERILAGALVAM